MNALCDFRPDALERKYSTGPTFVLERTAAGVSLFLIRSTTPVCDAAES